MSRLLVHVEGQTEETFVNAALAPHLYQVGVMSRRRGRVEHVRGVNRNEPGPAISRDSAGAPSAACCGAGSGYRIRAIS